MKHRMCRVLLCLVLTFALLLPMTVGALADTTIGTDASRPEYFEALGGSGSYNPLKTPYHYAKTTGNVAYCLEHKKDSPSSSAAYTDFDPSALWGHNTVTGQRGSRLPQQHRRVDRGAGTLRHCQRHPRLDEGIRGRWL